MATRGGEQNFIRVYMRVLAQYCRQGAAVAFGQADILNQPGRHDRRLLLVEIPLDAIGFGVGNRLEVLSLDGDVIANPDLASPDDLPEITAPTQKCSPSSLSGHLA